MTSLAVEIVRNLATAAQVAAHLRACEGAFVPPLAARVDIDVYAEKIVQHAERFEAWSGEQLAGLVATYCNDTAHRAAFITSVSVLPARQGEGIASRLLQTCTGSVRQTGFKRIELEVDTLNSAATRLYKKHGFAVSHTRDNLQTMHLAVSKDAP